MDKQQAIQILGLTENPTAKEVNQAYSEKLTQLNEKVSAAPTDALKEKLFLMKQYVEQAKSILLEKTNSAQSRSPLSQTKMADLPGTGPVGSTSVEHLQSGSTLSNGRYEIKEQIGEGGMGAVYHAFDTTRHEDMAIKVLLPSMVSSVRAKERFMNEAKISSKLSHPNIVNVLDVQEDGDLTFLVMELLEGQDLRTLMDNRKLVRQEFDEAEVKDLASKICDALQYAHKHTIHRDIKPENIWVTEEGEYKLMDFGIARVQSTSQRTQTGAAMGTAYYMAPEQLKGTSNVDGRADQYALGILLYELLSSDVPTGRFSSLKEIRKDLSKGFSNAVDKALAPNPNDRFEDMTDFSEALNKSKKGGGVKLPSMPSMPSIPTPSIKSMSIAAGILLVIAGGFVFNNYLKAQAVLEEVARVKSEKYAKAETIRKENEESVRLHAEKEKLTRSSKIRGKGYSQERFLESGRTWQDSKTGLRWQDNKSVKVARDWYQSIDYCGKLNLAGYSDWRLPSLNDFETLFRNKRVWGKNGYFINYKGFRASFKSIIKSKSWAMYWTDNYIGVSINSEKYVHFDLHDDSKWLQPNAYTASRNTEGKNMKHYARCVRSPITKERIAWERKALKQAKAVDKLNSIAVLCTVSKYKIRATAKIYHFSRNKMKNSRWDIGDHIIVLRNDGIIGMDNKVWSPVSANKVVDKSNKWRIQDGRLILSYGDGYNVETYTRREGKGILGKSNRLAKNQCMKNI